MLIDAETIDVYIQETNQSLLDIEKDLLTLENMGDNIDISLAKRIYRAMHIIKNGAALLSVPKIKELSQKIENVLGLICAGKLVPNPEVINILLQGIDRLSQLTNQIDTRDDMDIDEQSVLLTGLTSAVLPDEEKRTVTEVRKIPIPDSQHSFHIAEFNLIQGLDQGNNIYILIYDLIRDVQKKNNTPLNFVRFIQQHGEIIDSLIDIQTVGTLEEYRKAPNMPYFVLLASSLSQDQLIKALNLTMQQVHQVNTTIADLLQPKTELHHSEKQPLGTFSQRQKSLPKRNKGVFNSLWCELYFALDHFNSASSEDLALFKARIQSVLDGIGSYLNQENKILASKILWKINRKTRDHAYQSNIQINVDFQCGSIMMDKRILHRLINPLTVIIIKMIQTEISTQIIFKMIENATTIDICLSFADSTPLKQEILLEIPQSEEKQIQALDGKIIQSFDTHKGLSIKITIPRNPLIIPGYCVEIDNQYYLIPQFNVIDVITSIDQNMWRAYGAEFFYKAAWIPVASLSGLSSGRLYSQDKPAVVICNVGTRCFGLPVDSPEPFKLNGVCHPLSRHLEANILIAGNCLLDDGNIVFVLDMGFLSSQLQPIADS